MPSDRAHSPDGDIYYPDDTDYYDDFSTAPSQDRYTFIHELGHVWQHQNGVDVPLSAMKQGVGNYDYQDVFGDTPFESLSLEQQAQFFRDWKILKDAPPGSTIHGRDLSDYDSVYNGIDLDYPGWRGGI